MLRILIDSTSYERSVLRLIRTYVVAKPSIPIFTKLYTLESDNTTLVIGGGN